MAKMLRYLPSPADGLPRLAGWKGRLTAAERDELEAELGRRYDALVALDGREVELSPSRAAPDGRYLVRVVREHPRLRTLVLVPVAARRPRQPTVRDVLDELVGESWGQDAEAAAAFEDCVLGLLAFAERQPDKVGLLLLHGYLSLQPADGEAGRRAKLAKQQLARLWRGR